jgi:hypothetical protein
MNPTMTNSQSAGKSAPNLNPPPPEGAADDSAHTDSLSQSVQTVRPIRKARQKVPSVSQSAEVEPTTTTETEPGEAQTPEGGLASRPRTTDRTAAGKSKAAHKSRATPLGSNSPPAVGTLERLHEVADLLHIPKDAIGTGVAFPSPVPGMPGLCTTTREGAKAPGFLVRASQGAPRVFASVPMVYASQLAGAVVTFPETTSLMHKMWWTRIDIALGKARPETFPDGHRDLAPLPRGFDDDYVVAKHKSRHTLTFGDMREAWPAYDLFWRCRAVLAPPFEGVVGGRFIGQWLPLIGQTGPNRFKGDLFRWTLREFGLIKNVGWLPNPNNPMNKDVGIWLPSTTG